MKTSISLIMISLTLLLLSSISLAELSPTKKQQLEFEQQLTNIQQQQQQKVQASAAAAVAIGQQQAHQVNAANQSATPPSNKLLATTKKLPMCNCYSVSDPNNLNNNNFTMIKGVRAIRKNPGCICEQPKTIGYYTPTVTTPKTTPTKASNFGIKY